jgi:hypothetical protein
MELARSGRLKSVGNGDRTEISKKQRMIFEKMEIGVPAEADMVIKKAGV